ncbi:MAG: MFS transporter [Leptolyngbya sp. SIO3F4]|nr:MFS transporter [Leptolyngbya sp. SIO3F4]
MQIPEYNRKTVRAWTFYDWANSVYSLVISTAIFPIYYTALTTSETADPEMADQVFLFGFQFTNTALYDYAMAVSFLLIALLSPLLSGVADYSSRKKSFLRRFCYVGAIACMGLFFFDSIDFLLLALLLSMLASIGFWGSQVFYNAYLPEIAPPLKQDRVSAMGFVYGYIGSSLLLILCLVLIEGYEMFGFPDKGLATRVAFVLVGIWWVGFAQITFAALPEGEGRKSIHWRSLGNGYRELLHFWRELKERKGLQVYLSAYFFFSVGVQTVILLASVFGSKELGLPSSKLILTILVIQFVGAFGAYLFSVLSGKIGNLRSLMLAVAVWIIICLGAFFMRKDDPYIEAEFYTLGALVGLVLGGIQSLARSTYSKMLPSEGKHTTYFSFYDVSEKLALALGLFLFGLVEELTGNMHNSALVLGIFFLFSLFLLVRTRSHFKMF